MFQIYSALHLWSPDLDPDAVTRATGLIPASLSRRGEPKPNGNPHKSGRWTFTTRDLRRDSIEASLDDLFARVEPAWPALVELATRCSVAIEAYVHEVEGSSVPSDLPEGWLAWDGQPVLGFEARHVQLAAQLGAMLGIDGYDLPRLGDPEAVASNSVALLRVRCVAVQWFAEPQPGFVEAYLADSTGFKWQVVAKTDYFHEWASLATEPVLPMEVTLACRVVFDDGGEDVTIYLPDVGDRNYKVDRAALVDGSSPPIE